MTAEHAKALSERLVLLSGCVNLRPMWDVARGQWCDSGTLLMTGAEIDRASGRIIVGLSHDPEGWNNLPYGGKRYPATDRKGQPLYPSAVFPTSGWEYHITEAVRKA